MSIRMGLTLALAIVLAGCAGGTSAAPSGAVLAATSGPPAATPDATALPTRKPSPRPTPRPLTRKQAGPLLQAAIVAYRAALQKMSTKEGATLRCLYSTPASCQESQLAALRTHWHALATALDGYATALAKIGFPATAGPAAAAHLAALDAARTAAEAAADASTIETHNELADEAGGAEVAAEDTEYKLMKALDWIIGP